MGHCIKHIVPKGMETVKRSWHYQTQWVPGVETDSSLMGNKTLRKIKDHSAVSSHSSQLGADWLPVSSQFSLTVLRNIQFFFKRLVSILANSLRAGMLWIHHPQQTKCTAHFHAHRNGSMRIYRVINAEYLKWSLGRWAIRKVGPISACFMALAQWLVLGSP